MTLLTAASAACLEVRELLGIYVFLRDCWNSAAFFGSCFCHLPEVWRENYSLICCGLSWTRRWLQAWRLNQTRALFSVVNYTKLMPMQKEMDLIS
jgi:hypothetical protein